MFKVNQTIKVNGKSFTITDVSDANLIFGTREGDPTFLAGKRSIYVPDLKATKTGFKYNW